MNDIKDTMDRSSWQPVKVDYSDASQLESVLQTPGLQIADTYAEQLEELFLLRNPHHRFDKNYAEGLVAFVSEHANGGDMAHAGIWFYFPWSHTLVHYLEEQLHFEVRTGRNKNLILADEQDTYYNARVGLLGMSVGSHAAVTLAMTGGPKHLHLADLDTISVSNLNRIRTGVQNLAVPKVIAVARQIYEINPYSEISIYPEGLTDENMNGFLSEPVKLDVVVEEMDNPYFKLKIRSAAKAHGIPVVMATDNGDNIFVDIERYDTHSDLPMLNGIVGDLTAEQMKQLDPKDLPRTAAKIAGAQLATLRMQKSVLEVGKSLYSWPQLGTAANLCGSALAYLVRKLILKAPNIVSGRYEVNLDAAFESDYHTPEQENYRKEETNKFLKMIGLE